MHRFFLPADAAVGGRLVLDERDSAHAIRVLRLEVGESIEILNGTGRIFECRLIEANRRGVVAEVVGVRVGSRVPAVHLVPAIIKGRAMDFLIQKATELGVSVVSPIAAARCVVVVGHGRDAADKVAGWRQTAIEACKQCGNPWLPRIEEPVSLATYLQRRDPGPLLVGVLDPAAEPLGRAARRVATPDLGVALVVGPEGDLTAEEQAMLRESGAIPVTLGPLVLRAETAAIAGLAVLLHTRWGG